MNFQFLLLNFVFIVILTACNESASEDTQMTKFEIDRDLFPFQSRFISLEDGSKIHYIDEGTGPTILLLHGNPTWSFLYRDIITNLKDEFRLLAPDYPGFGLSHAAENYSFTAQEHARAISEFVQIMELDDFAIMMQDWGGPIGFHVALQNPKRVSRFIIGNTWAWPLQRTGQVVFSKTMGGWIGQLGAWCCNAVVRFFMSKGVVNKLKPNILEMYLAPFRQRHQRSATHIFPAQLTDAKIFLSQIQQQLDSLSDLPALLVWGMQDFAFQKPEHTRLESIFKQHQTVLLKNAGHFIQEDAPDEIAIAIRQFYKQ